MFGTAEEKTWFIHFFFCFLGNKEQKHNEQQHKNIGTAIISGPEF